MKKNIVLLTLFAVGNLLGQTSIIPKSLQIKSPQTFEFERQGNIPTSLYTGTINYGIPLFEFSKNDNSFINLSLSYNSSGFMPNKKTNYVGYNWSLNFGGVISRTVNGVTDENDRYSQPGGSLNVARRSPIGSQDIYSGKYTHWGNNYTYLNFEGHPQELNPDKFNFNFNGNSGFFYIGTDNIPIIYSNENKNLKIDVTNIPLRLTDGNACFTDYSEIIITDDEGNKYYFGGDKNNLEMSYNLGSDGAPTSFSSGMNQYVSAWYLKKISYYNGENLTISYKKIDELSPIGFFNFCDTKNRMPSKSIFGDNQYLFEPITYYSQQNVFKSYKESGGFLLGGGGHSSYVQNWPKKNFSMTNKLLPEEISSDYFKIKFNYTKFEGIGESYGRYMLSNISINNNLNELTRTVHLDYYDKGEYKFLKSLTLNNDQNYLFDYYNIDNLPPTNTFAIDYWGFWNGKGNDNKLIPSYKIDKNTNEITITSSEREPNNQIANTALLKKVTYPSKGYTIFEYLPNTYSSKVTRNLTTRFLRGLYSDGYMYNAGGARIWKITSNDGVNDEIKEFRYIKDFQPNTSNQKTSGILMQDYRMAEYENIQYPGYNGHTLIEVGQNLMPDAISSSHITYSEVQEYINGILQKNTKFTNFASNPDRTDISYRTTVIKGQESTAYLPAIYFDNVGISYPDTEYERGKVSEETFYKDGLNVVKRKSYLYSDLNNGKGFFDYKYQNEIGFTSTYKKLRQYYLYQFIPYINTYVIEVDYLNPNNSIISNSLSYKWDFDYDKKINIKNTINQNSKGEDITTEYLYPQHLTGLFNEEPYMKELVGANRIAEPVVVKQKVGNTYISEIHNQYAEFNGIIQKSVVHQKKGSGIDINKTDDRKVIYSSYDNRGNLTQYTLENGIPVSIIWGYNGQYPIAKIEGSTNTELSNYIQLAEGNIQSNNDTYKLIFEKIREHFPNSMITTYLYQPLVGVTSITAPNGQSEYYKYDASNRLEEIRNDKKEVIKTFKYNYKQP